MMKVSLYVQEPLSNQESFNMKKYLCIGGEFPFNPKYQSPPITYGLDPDSYDLNNILKIEAQWLPKWYGVPDAECVFIHESQIKMEDMMIKEPSGQYYGPKQLLNLIQLTYRPDKDYEEHLKVLKATQLLES